MILRRLVQGARSSAVEHYLDMVGVTGSIPVAPTILGRIAASDGQPAQYVIANADHERYSDWMPVHRRARRRPVARCYRRNRRRCRREQPLVRRVSLRRTRKPYARGYHWAELGHITDPKRCQVTNSLAFRSGFMVYTQDPKRGAELDDDGHPI